MDVPDTRPSLLLRVRDAHDAEAWHEFSAIYRPAILRLARMKGLQAADAEDLAQTVLLAVSRAVERWEPDPVRGRFRTWLQTIARNAALNALTRGFKDKSAADESIDQLLLQTPDVSRLDSQLLQTEYQREVFLRAAGQIRSEFSADTWNSFWLTAVEGMDVDVAARELARSRGSVYASRSRVMKRLKQEVEQLMPLVEDD
jgi:RNA polymerase sigma factor (sigma-70 family)